ncbi:MAG: hypothetical protein JSR45_18340 [Proteobacteria bacterium]|nr:hypothetical protein [Pseudomonadota bacterium]
MLGVIAGVVLMAGAPATAGARWLDTSEGHSLADPARCVDVRSIRKDDKGLTWYRQTECSTRKEISTDGVDCATLKAYYHDKAGALQENPYRKDSPYGVMVAWVCARK